MFDVTAFDVEKFDSILARGLCSGVGKPDGQMCIEAAICNVLGMPHDDDPKCVAASVRRFKIQLNDSQWSSPEARAKGMRDLGLAQLGSLRVVDDVAFAKRLAELTIRVLVPAIYREVLADSPECLAAADKCELDGDYAAAAAAAARARAADATGAYAAARAARAADAAADAAYAAAAAAAARARAADATGAYAAAAAAAAADAAAARARAADATGADDKYLLLSASLALQVLRELGSPGCQLLTSEQETQS
jgi:hypothetical protein